jgi:electron transfer flavoprotein alpha subunit
LSVLVILEQRGDSWNRMSFETVTAAQSLAKELNVPVAAAVLGANAKAQAASLSGLITGKLYAIDHPLLAQYTPDAYTLALHQLINKLSPAVVLFPHTYQVRDFAPKLAARFNKPLISDVVALRVEGDHLVFTRQLFQGRLNADLRAARDSLTFVSIQAGAFRAAEATEATAEIVPFEVSIDRSQIRSKADAPFRDTERTVDLSAANIIVSIGRGIKEKDNLGVVEELAGALHAELAASRPICDNGWLPMERQVGSSGQTVAPKVYFAIGISGAIQHLVGMKDSKTVVAINKDENAPIFDVADYGVVGDLFEVVPALVEEIKKAKS